jgi:hypothetical protein
VIVARFAVIVGMVAALLVGGGAAGGRSAARPIAPRNEIIARLDAELHLSHVALPASAARSRHEPGGDGGALAFPLSGPPATPNVVAYHHWWVVLGASPAAVIQYVNAHPPRGGRFRVAASFGLRGQPTLSGIEFSWPTEPRRLGLRWLGVEAVALEDGSTGVRADSQVVWITVRSKSDHIPPGARRLVLTTTRFGRIIQGPLTVTSPGAIRRAVRLLNGLPAAQPGAAACPADFGSLIRLAFYARESPGARPLAVAVVDPSGCGLVRLTIRGRREPPLGGGFTLVKRLSRALGVKIDAGAR